MTLSSRCVVHVPCYEASLRIADFVSTSFGLQPQYNGKRPLLSREEAAILHNEIVQKAFVYFQQNYFSDVPQDSLARFAGSIRPIDSQIYSTTVASVNSTGLCNLYYAGTKISGWLLIRASISAWLPALAGGEGTEALLSIVRLPSQNEVSNIMDVTWSQYIRHHQ